MQKTNEKKVLVLSFLGVITLIAVVVGATFAYFAAQSGGTGNININANTATTDNLSFQVGSSISLTANQEDFGSGMSNKSGSTFARAVLTANNTTNTATRNYYVYLNIASNDFEYTTGDEQAEILLKVTNPDGTEVTDIPGLTRKTSGSGENEVTGFDITTKSGSITIADNYEITSTGTEEQEWQVEVIFVNLDSDQNANTNKTFNANLIIREDSPIGITEVKTSNVTNNSITLTVEAESENTITNYYFAKNGEEYVSSASNTYTFTGLEDATEYTLKVYAVDNEGYQSAIYSFSISTEDFTFADYLTNNIYTGVDGDNGLYYHDGVGSYTNASQEAGDYSYRYAGANPNNYVCFGTTATTCPNDNLYRIIGVFNNQVKLIKYDYLTTSMAGTNGNYDGSYDDSTSYYKGSMSSNNIVAFIWNGNGTNSWSTSQMNTVNLNTNFINYLGSSWANKIANVTWQVGGASYDYLYSSAVKAAYNYEVGTYKTNITYNAKIGLMYASDYGYAASPTYWSTTLDSYDRAASNNWMYMGLKDWTISRVITSSNTGALFINEAGYTYNGHISAMARAARPVFYLNSNTVLSGGSGTKTNPYRIVL